MPISARNQLEGKVASVKLGDIMAHVVVKIGKSQIESVITRRSVDKLALKKGDKVADIVGVMVNLGKMPKAAVGAIHLFPRQSFVDVSDEHANRLMKKLNGIRFKGYELAIGRAS